jgi:SAM-dependent methyltransferase
MAKRIYRILKGESSAKILDVGCGFGDLIAELRNKYHFSVWGLEYSSYAVQKAHPSVRAKIRKGSILKLPFKKNSFDLVICFDVICYLTLKETIKAIKNLRDVSRGYIFFSSIYRHSRWASQEINSDKLRITTLSQKEYINLFSQNGAKFIKKFYGENSGDVLVFRKV